MNDEILLPVGLKFEGSDLLVILFKIKKTYFRDPFFVDSLAKYPFVLKSQKKSSSDNELLVRPIHYTEKDNHVVYKPFKKFIEENQNNSVSQKLGFIFHVSRCGSTLATQMLASSDRFFVLSEPTIVNSILDPTLNISDEDRFALLQASVVAFNQIAPDKAERIFIKFRSWNTLYMNLILNIFPNTKWLFVHRHGLEVLSSVVRKPPGWLRSRKKYSKYFETFLNVDSSLIKTMEDDDFTARMLGSFCHIADKSKTKNGLFVDYAKLQQDFFNIIQKHWDLNLSEKEKIQMKNISKLYSKDINKEKNFFPDSQNKRLEASELQQYLIEKYTESERKKLIN